MTAIDTQCPPDAVLSDFGLGKLDAARMETVSRHLNTCDACRRRAAGLSGDSFVGQLRKAVDTAPPVTHERTYVPGESLANAASSTDGSSVKEDGLPRPSRSYPARRDGLGSPSSVSALPELANHPDYELIKELGQGGMGTVYLARNRMMDRPEVLKVISKSLLDRPGALERFQQEIRSAAKLSHPNIVAAHSVLRPGDLLVFAMEYVRGQDLSEVVKHRGPLPVANAAFYIHQVANGLQHAFEKGMVHRDIKPNNLMLAIEGKKHIVKILDFGLAKATSEKEAETGLTKSGQMLGTPDYVAPEQTLDAQKADIRADIYSLGCTLYFLLAGGPPFQETSLYEILEAHHKRDPKPLNLVRPEVPVELAAVVGKMMAKDPTKRYQTPIEVAKALVPFFKPGQSIAPATINVRQTEPAAETQHGTASATAPSQIVPPPAPMPVLAVPPAIPVAAGAPPPTEISLSIGTQRVVASPRGWWSSLPPWQKTAAILAASSLAVLLLGIVFLVKQRNHVIGRANLPSPPIASAEPQVESAPAPPKETPSVRPPDRGRSGNQPPVAVASFDANQEGAPQEADAGDDAPLEVATGSDDGEQLDTDKKRESGSQPPAAVPFDANQQRAHEQAAASSDAPSEATAGSVGGEQFDTGKRRSSGASVPPPKGSGRSKPIEGDAGSRFRENSVWMSGQTTLRVVERKGNEFRARYRNPKLDLVVTGTIKGSEVRWLAKDYRKLKAPKGFKGRNYFGTITKDKGTYKIELKPQGGKAYALSLQTPK